MQGRPHFEKGSPRAIFSTFVDWTRWTKKRRYAVNKFLRKPLRAALHSPLYYLWWVYSLIFRFHNVAHCSTAIVITQFQIHWAIWNASGTLWISCYCRPDRLSHIIGGRREMDQLCTTSQVLSVTWKTKLSQNSWHTHIF